MRKRGRAALTVLFCVSLKVALAHAASQPAEPIRNPQVSDIFVPAELGYILETSEPASATASPLIIHIQEAHTNYEAQRNIIGILERLVQQHGLKLILVEGGSGDVGLAYLRAYGPPENRRDVGEKYLRLGILSAEEYLDIVSDRPLILWGVEDRVLYRQNVDAFLSAESLRKSLQPVLASIRETVELLKPRVLDPALAGLEDDARAFDEERLALADYVDRLIGLARQQGLMETFDTAHPTLSRFVAVRERERQLHMQEIGQEQQALLIRLSEAVSEDALDRLIEQATQMKAGTLSREAFYKRLEELTASAGVSLEGYPNLVAYLQYLTQRAELNPAALATELGQAAEALKASLASSPDSRELIAIHEQVDLVDKLLGFRLSPEEYGRLHTIGHAAMLPAWETGLHRLLTAHALSTRSFPRLEEFDSRLAALRRFYEAANQRDEALVANAIAKLQETREPLAVLITGGFHSPAITRLLTAQGVRVVVVAPKVGEETNEQLYEAVLKYKSGHGSLEEVMAIAGAS